MSRPFSTTKRVPPSLMIGTPYSVENNSIDSPDSSTSSLGLQSVDNSLNRTPNDGTLGSPVRSRQALGNDVDVVAEYYDRQRSNGTGSALQTPPGAISFRPALGLDNSSPLGGSLGALLTFSVPSVTTTVERVADHMARAYPFEPVPFPDSKVAAMSAVSPGKFLAASSRQQQPPLARQDAPEHVPKQLGEQGVVLNKGDEPTNKGPIDPSFGHGGKRNEEGFAKERNGGQFVNGSSDKDEAAAEAAAWEENFPAITKEQGRGQGGSRGRKVAVPAHSSNGTANVGVGFGGVGGVSGGGVPPGLFVYPMRAPKSRTAAALLNRLLDDTLGRLRLAATDDGTRGPTHGAVEKGLLAKSSKVGGRQPNITGSSLGGDGGGADSAAFDVTLGLLLDQAYAKTKCLADYIHMYAGTGDDGGGSKDQSGGGGGLYEYTQSNKGKDGKGLMVREQLSQSEAARASAELAAAATVEAAKKVLERSKEKRVGAEAECEVLRKRVRELEAALRLKHEAEASVRREAEEAAALQAEAVRKLAEKKKAEAAERAEAGLAPPLSPRGAARMIIKLELLLKASKAKASEDVDHLLTVLTQKKTDMQGLNKEMKDMDQVARDKAGEAKVAHRELHDKLAAESLAKTHLEDKLTAERAGEPVDDWFWEGEPDLETKHMSAKRWANAAASVKTAKKEADKTLATTPEEGGGDGEAGDLARHALNRMEAAHFKALKERQVKRRRALGGPLRGVVSDWHGRTQMSHNKKDVAVPPLQVSLGSLYELLESKTKKDRHDMFEVGLHQGHPGHHHHHQAASLPSTKLLPLVDFAETFFLQRYGLPSLAKNTMRTCLKATQKHFARFQKRYGRHFFGHSGTGGNGAALEGGGGGNGRNSEGGLVNGRNSDGSGGRNSDGSGGRISDGSDEHALSVNTAAAAGGRRFSAHYNLSAASRAEVRLGTRLRLLMRMLLLDDDPAATRAYTPRLAVCVGVVLDRCFGGLQGELETCLGSAQPLPKQQAPTATLPSSSSSSSCAGRRRGSCASAGSGGSGAPQRRASRALANSGGSSVGGGSASDDEGDSESDVDGEDGGGRRNSRNSISPTSSSAAFDAVSAFGGGGGGGGKKRGKRGWGIAKAVLVARKDVLAALLLSALPQRPAHSHDHYGGHAGGQSLIEPSTAKGGGKAGGASKKEHLTSAILVEIAKGLQPPKPAPLQPDNSSARNNDGDAGGPQGGEGSLAAAAAVVVPVPAVFFDPMNWRCPLLTGIAPTHAIQRLVRDVEALPVTPAPSALDGGAGGGGGEASGASSHHRGGGASASAAASGSGGGGGLAVESHFAAGEPLVDLDEFFEVLLSFFETECGRRIDDLEQMFHAYDARDGDLDGKLHYNEYLELVQDVNARIADPGGELLAHSLSSSSSLNAEGSPRSPTTHRRASGIVGGNGGSGLGLACDADASRAVSESDGFRYFKDLHMMDTSGGDCLMDSEMFAVTLFRDDHIVIINRSTAEPAPLPAS